MSVNLKIKPRVQLLLEQYPHLRDCDEKLLSNIWYYEAEKLGIDSLFAFLRAYSNGELTNSESVRRSRQKIQEEIPSLRGSNYKHRQNYTDVIKEELGYNTTT